MSIPDVQRRLLEAIAENPDTTQASLALQLGVAVGSVNWYLKRLVRKGYVKVTRLQRRKLKYFLTPQGLALKVQLTSQYMEASLRMYRELRRAAEATLAEIRSAGYNVVQLEEDSEAGEIFYLTCLQHGFQVMPAEMAGVPTVVSEGSRFVIHWPDV